MHIIGYRQTTDTTGLEAYVSGDVPEGSVVEITIYNSRKATADDKLTVTIDGKPAYDLDFKTKKYCNMVRDTEFYLTDAEAFALYMYLNNFNCQITPHWWPYAERNIARHGNPMKELNEAKQRGAQIGILHCTE